MRCQIHDDHDARGTCSCSEIVKVLRALTLSKAPPSTVDQRRLRTGAHALVATAQVPETIVEIRAQLEVVHAGIAALQSLDDLGPEANARAQSDERELWKRYEALTSRLAQLEGKKS